MIPIPGTSSLEHLADNIGATEVAAQLTDEEVRALTSVEDEESATLSKMSAQMVDAFGASPTRIRLTSAGQNRWQHDAPRSMRSRSQRCGPRRANAWGDSSSSANRHRC
jgi:hypothetical protein